MFALAEQRIKLLYDDAYTRALKIAEVKKALDDAVNADFNFKAFPRAQKQLKSIMEELSINIEKVAKNGLDKAVSSGLEASIANVLAISSAKETKKMAEEATDASRLNQAFGTRIANAKRGGITLSENIWKAVSASAKELEIIIQNNIIEGKGAVVASREVRQYLNDPRRLYRRVKDKETGEYKLSKAAQQYHPGQGKYRSSYMNARRLMVSEMNMATQASECEAYASNPLIAGYEIRLSNNHTVKDPNHKGEVLPLKDICDELQGLYPPTFKFTGWHPHCYSNDSEVLTNRGWKLFKDVMATDLILSLNPHTFNVEWTSIVMREVYEHIGAMVHFYNKSLDCLVTPDHTMVYLNKADGRIKECSADKFRQAMGAFYRSSKYEAEDRQFFDFGSLHIDFDVFCEFMGYWLSDGSLIRDNQVKISQMRGQGAFEQITQCVSRFAKPFRMKNDVCFGSREMNEYLKQFGTCHNKFIPYEIKNASRRQIKIFLDAFIKCDGNERPLKSFVGNRGTVCNSTKAEKIFFTTSHQLMSDICELILKAGMRPSVSTQDSGVAIKKNGTVINSNLPVFRVSICYSETSTVFGKEKVDYDGLVYDLTLAKNHIMYIKRNGKCFWGSNCRCSMVPVLISPEERRKLAQARAEGKPYKPSGVVTDVPANFKNWLANNQDRIANAKTLPFFLQDNGELKKDGYVIGNFDQETATEISFDKEIAEYLGIKPKQSENEPLLFADPTGGVATQVYGIIKKGIEKINVAKANKEKTQILQGIISNKAFNKLKYYSTKENSVYGINMGSYDKALKEGEIPANLNMAKKFVKNKYDVYLLSNPSDEKSADLIIRRKEKLYYVEGKTSSGGSSFINRLKEGSSQSERVSVNLLGQKLSIRHMAGDIKDAFAAKPNLNDLYLFKGSRLIVIHRDEAMSKEFPNKFIKIWSAAK